MPLAARQGDTVTTGHACDTTTTLAQPGQSSVFVVGKNWCRLGDLTVAHDIPVDEECVAHTAAITGSSNTVFVVGVKCARVGDGADAGSISSSTQDSVFAG